MFSPSCTVRMNACVRITQQDYAPEGVVEKVGDMAGLVDRRVEGDLERFKAFIESRGTETGGWRGDIENRSDSPDAPHS